jgi:molybdopterin biosynthesis enzyme
MLLHGGYVTGVDHVPPLRDIPDTDFPARNDKAEKQGLSRAFSKAESISRIPDKKVNRVRITMSDEMMVTPLVGRSGILNPLTKSNGLISIPAGYERTMKGSAAGVTLS